MKYTFIPPNQPPKKPFTAYARPTTLGEHKAAFMAANLYKDHDEECFEEEVIPNKAMVYDNLFGHLKPLIDSEYKVRRALFMSTHVLVQETMELQQLENAEILGNLEKLKTTFDLVPGVIGEYLRSVNVTHPVFEEYLSEPVELYSRVDTSEYLHMVEHPNAPLLINAIVQSRSAAKSYLHDHLN